MCSKKWLLIGKILIDKMWASALNEQIYATMDRKWIKVFVIETIIKKPAEGKTFQLCGLPA